MTHQPGYLQSTIASRSRSPEKKKISITIPKEKDIEEKEFLTSSLEPSPALPPVIPQSQSPFSASPSTVAALAEAEDELLPTALSILSAEEAAVYTPPTPKSLYQIKARMEGLVESIPTYYGRKDGSEDTAK